MIPKQPKDFTKVTLAGKIEKQFFWVEKYQFMILNFHFTADDPTEDTVQSRALTMMAASSYAIKEKKKKERSKREGVGYDEVVTESLQEGTCKNLKRRTKETSSR